jgi:hypothetical protein
MLSLMISSAPIYALLRASPPRLRPYPLDLIPSSVTPSDEIIAYALSGNPLAPWERVEGLLTAGRRITKIGGR